MQYRFRLQIGHQILSYATVCDELAWPFVPQHTHYQWPTEADGTILYSCARAVPINIDLNEQGGVLQIYWI